MIKTIGCSCMWLRKGLCSVLWSWCEPLYLFFHVPTFFLNIIPWDLRNTNKWSGDMGFALGHGLSTDWIIPLHHEKIIRNLRLCPCYKSHNDTWKWQDQPRIPLANAFGEEAVDLIANVDLFVCEEIKRKNGPWSWQGSQILHRVEVKDHYGS